MNKQELQIALNAEAAAPGSLRRVITGWKNQGASQHAVYQLCDQLRTELENTADRATYDRLLEVMDIVGGYCPPKERVWDTQLV